MCWSFLPQRLRSRIDSRVDASSRIKASVPFRNITPYVSKQLRVGSHVIIK